MCNKFSEEGTAIQLKRSEKGAWVGVVPVLGIIAPPACNHFSGIEWNRIFTHPPTYNAFHTWNVELISGLAYNA